MSPCIKYLVVPKGFGEEERVSGTDFEYSQHHKEKVDTVKLTTCATLGVCVCVERGGLSLPLSKCVHTQRGEVTVFVLVQDLCVHTRITKTAAIVT